MSFISSPSLHDCRLRSDSQAYHDSRMTREQWPPRRKAVFAVLHDVARDNRTPTFTRSDLQRKNLNLAEYITSYYRREGLRGVGCGLGIS
jgi:hypothetical protein